MMRRILIPLLIFLAVSIFAFSSVSASSSDVGPALLPTPTLVPGNYCISCHMANDPRLVTATQWKGNIGRDVNSPCPAATTIHEQLYYTERMMLMIERAGQSVGSLPPKSQTQLANYTQSYSRQLDEPVTSLNAFTSEAQTTRYHLNQIYSSLNQMADAEKQRTVLIVAALVTLFVLGSLAWGFYNTCSLGIGKAKRSLPLFWHVVIILVVLGLFTLPILRVPAAAVAMPSAAEQQVQTVLDTASRQATTADNAEARAWALADVAVAWNAADPSQAQTVLNEALSSAQQAQANDDALWGQSFAVQEAAAGVSIDMEKAALVATNLDAARARAWSVPLIAVEWNTIEPARAVELLQAEQTALSSRTGIYRDLQLRSVALAWAKVEPQQALPTAEAIQDPFTRSWTLREVGTLTNNQSAFDRATEVARQVADPVQRARALDEVAASGNASLFDEALSALTSVTGAPLAYALSDLAVASGNASLVERIDPAYPDARAAALLYLRKYQAAWDASAAIADPYEQAHARAAIAGAWGNADAAKQIEVPLYRDLALRDVIRKTGNAALTDSIQSPYYKVQALTALDEYPAAVQAGAKLGDSYPLVELAATLAKNDPQTATALVDKMTSETDKAAALRAIAAASGNQTAFEQAQGMALAARVSGNPLSPSEASLDLANLFWQINPVDAQSALRQAYEAAELIPIK